MRGSGGEVHEEWLVWHKRLLLASPVDSVVGQVLGQVIAFLLRCGWIDRCRAFIQRWVILVVFPADEAIKMLEATASRWPMLEGSHRAGLPHRHLVALAEHGGGVAI